MVSRQTYPSLRDALLHALSPLPNQHELGLSVFTSSSKRTTSIFPHAPSATGRCWETDYLVTLTSSLPSSPSAPDSSTPLPSSDPSTSPPTPPNVLVSAISAHLYTLPTDSSASILYISKVDSSGYTPPGSPSLTKHLVVAFLSYFLSPATRPSKVLTVTLFARSQGQYLFPDSSKGGGKKVLGGLGLCGWWKGVFEEVARTIVGKGACEAEISLTYLLPSYSAEEAKGMLGLSRKPLPAPLEWSYSPPFASPLLTSANGTSDPLPASLATLIPSVPDDPKTRFLEELVLEVLESSTSQSARSTAAAKDTGSGGGKGSEARKRSWKERSAAEDEEERKRAHAVLGKISAEEFWERMGFRQECISGDVTGFFTITAATSGGHVAAAVPKAVIDGDSTESTPLECVTHSNGATHPTTGSATPTPASTVPPAIVERLLASLVNTDFHSLDTAIEGSRAWLASTKAIVVDEIGESGWAASTGIVGAKEGVEVSGVGEGGEKRKEPVVTMLQPRKKKKV